MSTVFCIFYRPQFDDLYDDNDRFDDYDYDRGYKYNDFYESDRQEMIFDASDDEWEPVWW